MVVAASSSAVGPDDVREAALTSAGLGATFDCSCWVELSVFAGSAAGGLCGFLCSRVCSRVAEGAQAKLSWPDPERAIRPSLPRRRMEFQTSICFHYGLTPPFLNPSLSIQDPISA